MRDAGGLGATRTRRGWSLRSRPAATRFPAWRGDTDCRRSNCLAGGGKSRKAQAVIFKDNEARFVPAVVDAAPSGGSGHLQRKARRQHRDEPLVGTIEVAIDGATVRIGAGAPADTIAAVLRALKAGA